MPPTRSKASTPFVCLAYSLSGVITACGGPLFYPAQPRSSSPGPHEAEPAQAGSGATSTSGFTHMVHFRFSNTAQAKAFLRQPLVKVR